MALTASYPLIDDLAMKFKSHSLQESFQLPTFCPNWQAKDFALYFQPGFIADPNFDQTSLFEFKASGTLTAKRNNRYSKVLCDRANVTKHSPRHSPRHSPKRITEQGKANKPQATDSNPANILNDKATVCTSKAVKVLDFDEDVLSDDVDEELSCYFALDTERCDDKFIPKPFERAVEGTRSHNRKRSMEDEECLTIKRCCRPRLNFDKMLLNSRGTCETTESGESPTNYFRPISPDDLLS